MINFKKTLILAAAVFTATISMASTTSDVMDRLKKNFPNIVFTEVNETPVAGVYEAVFGKDIIYVDASATYFFPTMINMVTKENLGDARRSELNKVEFSELPFNDAIKTVYGNGSRKLAVFADPNCGYCKKLETNLSSMKDVTIYTFPIGILGSDSTAKAISISCATGDKSKTWHAMMVDGAKPVDKTCDNPPSERNLALFKKMGFQGTPAIIFTNGTNLKGYADNTKLEQMMSKK